MADDAFAAAEKRGYSKGYAAGKRRAGREVDTERLERARAARENAFWRQAMCAALTTCCNVHGWTKGDKPISNIADRVDLARDFADQAVLVARNKGRI